MCSSTMFFADESVLCLFTVSESHVDSSVVTNLQPSGDPKPAVPFHHLLFLPFNWSRACKLCPCIGLLSRKCCTNSCACLHYAMPVVDTCTSNHDTSPSPLQSEPSDEFALFEQHQHRNCDPHQVQSSQVNCFLPSVIALSVTFDRGVLHLPQWAFLRWLRRKWRGALRQRLETNSTHGRHLGDSTKTLRDLRHQLKSRSCPVLWQHGFLGAFGSGAATNIRCGLHWRQRNMKQLSHTRP